MTSLAAKNCAGLVVDGCVGDVSSVLPCPLPRSSHFQKMSIVSPALSQLPEAIKLDPFPCFVKGKSPAIGRTVKANCNSIYSATVTLRSQVQRNHAPGGRDTCYWWLGGTPHNAGHYGPYGHELPRLNGACVQLNCVENSPALRCMQLPRAGASHLASLQRCTRSTTTSPSAVAGRMSDQAT